MNRPYSTIVLVLALLPSIAAAQQQAEPQSPMPEMPMMQRGERGEQPSAESSPKMEHMADAMASMAQACETMMKREMAAFPLKMAALGIVGIILSIALILLVVLEVQWIRLLGLRIQQAKRELSVVPVPMGATKTT
jgi:hypothetical protein